jgi:hypothetical protein
VLSPRSPGEANRGFEDSAPATQPWSLAMKLLLVALLLLAIALGCIYEMVYLEWLSATPITKEHLAKIQVEYYLTEGLLVFVFCLGVALFFILRERKKERHS